MKKAIILSFVAAIFLSSCGTMSYCPTYGKANNVTKHGQKAQAKYTKNVRKF